VIGDRHFVTGDLCQFLIWSFGRACFSPDAFCSRRRHNRSFDQQLQPERRFICFLDNNAKFRNEIFVRPAAAHRTVIRTDCWPAAKQLPADDACFIRLRKQAAEFDDRQRERFCPLPKFVRSHASETRM